VFPLVDDYIGICFVDKNGVPMGGGAKMKTPLEFNPYLTMVELLLMEAAEMDADQVLMISRSEKTNLYFVSDHRVRKMVQLEVDVTPDLIDNVSSFRRNGQFVHVNHAENSAGKCLSFTIERNKSIDINATVPMPRVC